jgi:membrane-bound metal-dependent hydrolase YbcI (DUF457 family)
MPNGNIHRTAGAIFGTIVYQTIQNTLQPNEKYYLGELILSLSIGMSTARLPDILEPPIHPNHRAFFHSIVFGGITVYIGTQVWKDLQIRRIERIAVRGRQWSFNEFADIAIIIASSSVLLHLILDGFTPKGLNFI